jgi:hypothetical protein
MPRHAAPLSFGLCISVLAALGSNLDVHAS